MKAFSYSSNPSNYSDSSSDAFSDTSSDSASDSSSNSSSDSFSDSSSDFSSDSSYFYSSSLAETSVIGNPLIEIRTVRCCLYILLKLLMEKLLTKFLPCDGHLWEVSMVDVVNKQCNASFARVYYL